MLASTQPNPRWSCEHCFSVFIRWQDILAHKTSCHPQGGENQCIQCLLYFEDRNQLVTHITTAHDGRPEPTSLAGRNRIACEQCSKAKAGCDRKVPCMRCLSKGLECRPKHALRKMRFPFDRKALQRRTLSAIWPSTTLPDIAEAHGIDDSDDQCSTLSAPCSAMDWTLDKGDFPGSYGHGAFHDVQCRPLTDTSSQHTCATTVQANSVLLEHTPVASASESSPWIVPITKPKYEDSALGTDGFVPSSEDTPNMIHSPFDALSSAATPFNAWLPGSYTVDPLTSDHRGRQQGSAIEDSRPTSDPFSARNQKISKTQKIWYDFLTLKETDLGQLYRPPQLRELLDMVEIYAKRAIKLFRNKGFPCVLQKALKFLRRWHMLCGQQLGGTGNGFEDLLKFTMLSLDVVLESIISAETTSPRLSEVKSLRLEALDCRNIASHHGRIKKYREGMPPDDEKWEEDLLRIGSVLDFLGLLSMVQPHTVNTEGQTADSLEPITYSNEGESRVAGRHVSENRSPPFGDDTYGQRSALDRGPCYVVLPHETMRCGTA